MYVALLLFLLSYNYTCVLFTILFTIPLSPSAAGGGPIIPGGAAEVPETAEGAT